MVRTTSNRDAMDRVLTDVVELLTIGYPVVPTCRPLDKQRCSAGWHEVPCASIGKRPLVIGYSSFPASPPTEENFKDWRREFGLFNIAIVTGGEIVVVEADSPDAERELDEMIGEMLAVTPTRERRPTRGRGYIFSIPAGMEVRNQSKRGRSGAIDVRGSGGIYVVPPSLHATGHQYSWVPGREPSTLNPPEIPAALLELIPAPSQSRRSRHKDNHPAEILLETGLSPRVAFLLNARPSLAKLWRGADKNHGDKSNSGYDFAFVSALLDAKVPPSEAQAALLARPNVSKHNPDYARRTVQAALRKRS
jgi:hypothetical protein